jgi:hypothetical protein
MTGRPGNQGMAISWDTKCARPPVQHRRREQLRFLRNRAVNAPWVLSIQMDLGGSNRSSRADTYSCRVLMTCSQVYPSGFPTTGDQQLRRQGLLNNNHVACMSSIAGQLHARSFCSSPVFPRLGSPDAPRRIRTSGTRSSSGSERPSACPPPRRAPRPPSTCGRCG